MRSGFLHSGPARKRAVPIVAAALLFGALQGAVPPSLLAAQSSTAAAHSAGAEGTWQGTLHVPGRDLRTVLKITKAPTGALTGQFFSIDQGGQPINLSSVSLADGTLRYAIKTLDLTYEGRVSPDGNIVTGNTTQGGSTLPLNFERATQATAWEIPTPPPPIKPMAADADPGFDVATVKPSKPDQPGKLFHVEGRRFTTINTTLVDLIDFAYGTHPKQLVNAPAWAATDKFDLAATPDAEGEPNNRQWKAIVQKLLADRFQLKFHRDTREMPAYVLTLGKSGPKMDKGEVETSGMPGLFFTQLGNFHVTNATMDDFCHVMQEAVMDRPMVNQTKLNGTWNFNLKWTPDETQFAGLGAKVTPPTETADAPPPLFTAIQEEIGLKLDATRAAVPVLVLDHVEKVAEN